MRNTFVKLILSVLFILGGQNLTAQKYDEYAAKVRAEVWAWDLPQFNNYTVPDEYKGESAVILAIHEQITATGKSKFRVNAALAFNINKELLYTNTNRVMIKINDKVSLEQYATISFREQTKQWGYMMSSKFQTIVGARIIKPDGTIKEVNVKDEAVDMTEGKKDKVNHKKLAISDLQVGDILDYFIRDEAHVDTQNIPPLSFVFGYRYPVLHYSVHCEIGEKLTTEYRSVNGAPDFVVSSNEDKDIVLDVQKENIPKIEGLDRWISSYREFPMIRMSILNNGSNNMWKPKTARKKGLYKDVPPATVLDDAKSAYGDDKISSGWWLVKEVKKLVDNHMTENPGITQEELAAYIYDALQYSWRDNNSGYYAASSAFIRALNGFLRYYKIDFKLAFVTNRYGARTDELVNRYDLHRFTLANNDGQIFTYNPPFNIAGEVDASIAGESAITFKNYRYKGNMIEGEEGQFTVPVTDENHNTFTTNMNVGFADDLLLLDINRESIIRGALKRDYQFRFVTNEQWEQEMRARLGMKTSKLQELAEKKESRKYLDDYKELFEKERKEFIDKFKEEINVYHEAAPKEVVEYAVKYLGITRTNPDFISGVKYQQEGLVQKAGNNYILNVGKLIGRQLELKGDDRKRNVDIYIPSAQSFEHNIEIAIPDGYTISDIENLNKNMDTAAGLFVSSATIEGQTLKVKTRKVYKHAYEPVNNWDDLLKMLDTTVDFCSQSVVLRKI